jgi:capsid assembly protease
MLRWAGRPLALAPRALALLQQASRVEMRGEAIAPGFYGYRIEAGIAVVPVIGPMVARADWLSSLFGMPSYAELTEAIAAAFADPSARAVLLEVDSPGGEVGGLFDLVEEIEALKRASGKPLWAVASESALSAAYAIACVADRLYVTRTGEVGSVGVVAIHLDESAADAAAGLKYTLVHAGERKVDGNPHEPLSDTAFAAIQADVDRLHAEFVGLVARHRRLSPDAVRATEAAVYRGERAVRAGLADRVGTVAQAVAALSEELDRTGQRPGRTVPSSLTPSRRSPEMTTENQTSATTPPADPEAGAAPVAVPTPVPPAPVQPAEQPTNEAARLRAEYAEIAAIAAQAARLGIPVDAAQAMRDGVRPEALRRSVLDALSARTEASAVVAAAPTAAAPGDSPIVRRARERAAASRT